MDNIERTERILGLIKDGGFAVSKLEKELGYTNGAFKVRDGSMSGKVLDMLEDYFAKVGAEKQGVHTLVRRFGNYRPTYVDGVARFRDVYEVKGEDRLQNNGLWKRYDDWAYIGVDKSKDRRIKNGWESDGEVYVDDLGEFTKLENGVKVYSFPKEEG